VEDGHAEAGHARPARESQPALSSARPRSGHPWPPRSSEVHDHVAVRGPLRDDVERLLKAGETRVPGDPGPALQAERCLLACCHCWQ